MTRPKPNLCHLPGYGPWRILDECPAQSHNTLRAAERGYASDPLRSRCICPRGLSLLAENSEAKKISRNAYYQAKKTERAAGTHVDARTPCIRYVKETASVPDMSGAACGTPEGVRLVDRLTRRSTQRNFDAVRELCENCPIKLACRAWVLGAEKIPGSWGGVYGGLTPVDRLNIAAKEEGIAA